MRESAAQRGGEPDRRASVAGRIREALAELGRFCDATISIREEIRAIGVGLRVGYRRVFGYRPELIRV